MADTPTGPGAADGPPLAGRILEGRIMRTFTTNALRMTFSDGPDEPLGSAVQSAADSIANKTKVLFGLKNGGTGTHVFTPSATRDPAAQPLHVESRDREPTRITRRDGEMVATITRGPVCIASDPQGREVLRWCDHPDGADTPDAFRLAVTTPDDEPIARLDVIRTITGWSLVHDLWVDSLWFGRAGQPLKIPMLGTTVQLLRALTPTEHELVVASCIDMAIGLRPYGTAMG